MRKPIAAASPARRRRRLAGGERQSVAARRRHKEHHRRHRRAPAGVRRDQRRRNEAGLGEARDGVGADQQRDGERADAVGADPAVAHDRELPLARVAAAEAVGGVGEPVLMQAAGDEERRGDRQHRRRPGKQHQSVRDRIDQCGDQPDHEARQRKRPGAARHRAVFGRMPRQRQPRQEHDGGGELAGALREPRRPFVPCRSLHGLHPSPRRLRITLAPLPARGEAGARSAPREGRIAEKRSPLPPRVRTASSPQRGLLQKGAFRKSLVFEDSR